MDMVEGDEWKCHSHDLANNDVGISFWLLARKVLAAVISVGGRLGRWLDLSSSDGTYLVSGLVLAHLVLLLCTNHLIWHFRPRMGTWHGAMVDVVCSHIGLSLIYHESRVGRSLGMGQANCDNKEKYMC